MLEPIQGYARRKGFRRQQAEVQFYEHSMDLYCCALRHDDTMAVELKLSRWQRALEQAVLYQLCADFVYIALPALASLRAQRSLLQQHGIGLIVLYDGPRCAVVLPARRSGVLNPRYKAFYRQLLIGGQQ